VEDHVHLLASLSRTCAAAEMVKEVKRGSSLWAKERDALMRDFGWQNGYGMFSIGASQIEDVRRYIAEGTVSWRLRGAGYGQRKR
jgi:REP element-mobilizing transposase RayT